MARLSVDLECYFPVQMARLSVEFEFCFHAVLRQDLRIVKFHWSISARLSKRALEYPHGCR
eukprot:258353-Ditylum_brightwellii.AAC.1